MSDAPENLTNRVLVVDDDAHVIGEYVQCLGVNFEPDSATSTLGDLEKVLLGEDNNENGTARFEVHSRNQGDAAVEAVQNAVEIGQPYAIVFLDTHMPPGIDGIDAAKQIRELDPHINIVIVTDSMGLDADTVVNAIPPSDKIFFFTKPFHGVECRQLAAALCGKWHSDMALRYANEELEQRVEERTAALHKLAYYDPVTRLPNKHRLLDDLQSYIDDAEDGEGDTVVVLIDIDRFSFINETMGYDAGTELLRSIGSRLNRLTIESDGYQAALIGRVGADEFAVIVPAVENDDRVRSVAERVKQSTEEPFLIDGRDLFLNVAMGVAWHPVHGRDARSVYRCAEAALHRSMRSLDHAITFYHQEMRFRARHKFDMEAELRVAIDNGDIHAWYQPQQSTEDGALAGVEALARWLRPDGSIVQPDDFITLGDEMGVSDIMFESILNSVCNDVAAWNHDADWDIPVSINLSAHQLRNRDLIRLIKRVLVERSIDRKLINLELTETVLLEDLTIAQPILDDLSAYGVGIHIDDFGTGYSSLSYLAQLPVQALKIDRTFVSKLSESESTVRVVQAIVALGKAMNLKVVAEGVESDQQFAIVRRLGCDLVQGFFIARPMPGDRLMTWCGGYEDTQSLKHGPNVVGIDRNKQ